MTYALCVVHNREFAWPTTHVIFTQRVCATYDSSDFSRDFQTEGSCDLRLSRFPDRERESVSCYSRKYQRACVTSDSRDFQVESWHDLRLACFPNKELPWPITQTKRSRDLLLSWFPTDRERARERERERGGIPDASTHSSWFLKYYEININAFFLFLLVLATNNLQATHRNVNKTKLNTFTYICCTPGLLINDCA